MSQFFYIHPDNPQQRLINQAVDIVRKGGVIVIQPIPAMPLVVKLKTKAQWSAFAASVICRTATTSR
ncbi:YciO family [Salmonella enterica subsp. enterica serovar Thompson]|nr:YciO family [Salmonella enterica subsp. enterica serovar Thompson]